MSSRLLDAPGAPVASSRTDALTETQALRWGLVLLLAHVIVWVGAGIVPTIAELYPLAQSPQPYFVPQHFAQLYLLGPFVVLSTCVMLLAPGLLLALACGYGTTLPRLVLYAFPLSLFLISGAAAIVQVVIRAPVTGVAFVASNAVCTFASILYLRYRLARGVQLARPARVAWPTASLLGLPAFVLITLVPKFFWENFNGDGAHAFESARLLLHQPVPFWDKAAGEIAAFPGVTSMLFAYPASWFIRLFGNYEAAARLPYLLYLMVLFAGVWTLIDLKRTRPALAIVPLFVAAALVVYTISIGFSATYSWYSADIALPATQDTLLVVCFIGFIAAWTERRHAFLALFAALTYVSLPNGLLMLGCWLVAVALVVRPIPWRRLFFGAALLVGCMVVAAILTRLLPLLHLPAPGGEYNSGALLHRFRHPQLTQLRRFAFMLVPTGILPGLALLLWRRQDELARAITLVTVAMFSFFYVQSGTALHYFIPVMLLPLVVYWRLEPFRDDGIGVRATLLTAAALLVALWLVFPASLTPGSLGLDRRARIAGSAVEFHGTGYDAMRPAAFRRAAVLHFAFPYEWNRAVPDTLYGGSPIAWNYYANRKGSSSPKNYIVQRATDPAPADARLLGVKQDWAIYVRSDSVWQSQRHMRRTAPAGARIFTIPRAQKFR